MPAATKAKSLFDRPVVGKLLEMLLQVEAWVPLAYWSIGLAIASLLWALFDLMTHTLGGGCPAERLAQSGLSGSLLNRSIKYAFLPAIGLGVAGAARDTDTRRAGIVGAGLGLLAVAVWAVTRAILKLLNPELSH